MVDSPINKLKLLSKLNIEGGISLQVLYEEISSLVYLLELIVCSTDKLFKLRETLGNLKSLNHSSSQLPHFIGRLMDPVHLCLLACPVI